MPPAGRAQLASPAMAPKNCGVEDSIPEHLSLFVGSSLCRKPSRLDKGCLELSVVTRRFLVQLVKFGFQLQNPFERRLHEIVASLHRRVTDDERQKLRQRRSDDGRAPMPARSPLLRTSSARDGNGLSTGVRGRLLDIRMKRELMLVVV
jgi:hypothetical protein